MFFRTGYNYDADKVSEESGLSIDPDESIVQGQFADECDINTLVRRFGVTGTMPQVVQPMLVGDFDGAPDFRAAMDIAVQARQSFDSLPLDLRKRFGFDAGLMLEFLDNPENRDEAIRIGLVVPKPEPVRSAVQAIDDLAAQLKPPIQ